MSKPNKTTFLAALGMYVPLWEHAVTCPGETQLLCPICKSSYVHHEAKAVIAAGNDNYEAHPSVRSSVICLPMHCEEGHRWRMMFGFHKGSTYVWCDRLPDFTEDNYPNTNER